MMGPMEPIRGVQKVFDFYDRKISQAGALDTLEGCVCTPAVRSASL